MGTTRGWRWGAHDRRSRWGVNDVDSVEDLGGSVGELLVFDFDAVLGQEECHLTDGDSGGAVFIKDGPDWKLAGINYSVDGYYDTDAVCGDGDHFIAAMFDATGFYIGADNGGCDNWDLITGGSPEAQSRSYATRVSASKVFIQGVIQSAIDDAALTALERYEDWIDGYGVGAEDGPEEHGDGDQWRNLLEYFGATDPSAEGGAPVFRIMEGPGVLQFEVRERLDFESRGLSWEITELTDPGTGQFDPVAGLSEVSTVVSRAEGVTTRVLEIPMPGADVGFYRLEVTLGP